MSLPFDISAVRIADALVLPRGISPELLGISVGLVAGMLVFGLVFLALGRRRAAPVRMAPMAKMAGMAGIEIAAIETMDAIDVVIGPRPAFVPSFVDETGDSQIVIVEESCPMVPAVTVSRVVMVGDLAASVAEVPMMDDAATVVSDSLFGDVTRRFEARP